MKFKSFLFLTLVFSIGYGLIGESKKKKVRSNPLAPIAEVENLPNVLIIGDSISIGYTLPTRALLKEKLIYTVFLPMVVPPQRDCQRLKNGWEKKMGPDSFQLGIT